MPNPPEDTLRAIYRDTTTIAVVGASGDDTKPSHNVPRYLQAQGYTMVPVNPKGGEIWGEEVRASLSEIGAPVDVVQVFRPAEETPAIAAEAVAIGAKVLWLQTGIHNEEAERIARDGGLEVVMDICMGQTHAALGLGPGPD